MNLGGLGRVFSSDLAVDLGTSSTRLYVRGQGVVLDEPSVGLHPCDIDRLVVAIRSLRDRDNTVVVVEHEEAMLRAADQLIEIGPGAGERGGQVTFQGTMDEMMASTTSLTGAYLCGRRGVAALPGQVGGAQSGDGTAASLPSG